MKQAAPSRAVALKGRSVKVVTGSFLIGLSFGNPIREVAYGLGVVARYCLGYRQGRRPL